VRIIKGVPEHLCHSCLAWQKYQHAKYMARKELNVAFKDATENLSEVSLCLDHLLNLLRLPERCICDWCREKKEKKGL